LGNLGKFAPWENKPLYGMIGFVTWPPFLPQQLASYLVKIVLGSILVFLAQYGINVALVLI